MATNQKVGSLSPPGAACFSLKFSIT